MNTYPRNIKYNDYARKWAPLAPQRPNLQLARTTSNGTTQNTVQVPVQCAANLVSIKSLKTNATTNKTYDANHADIAGNDATRFCFAPVNENLSITWAHINPTVINKTRLELFCLVDGVCKRIWMKTYIWGVNQCPATAKTEFNGDLNTNDVVKDKGLNNGLSDVLKEDNDIAKTRFPGGLVTAEFSPYKLIATPLPNGSNTTAPSNCMYFDIIVKDIDLEWCPQADLVKILPNTNMVRNRAMCNSLMDANDASNLNGAIPTPGQTKKVLLKSHTFYRSAAELVDISYYNRYKLLWGDGPIIPVFAKAKIKDSAGNAQDVPLALGKLRFMWDWTDKATDPYTVINDANIQAWVDETRNYKAAPTAESPLGKNCHVDRGGKRGMGALTCFPQQAGKPPSNALPVHDGSDQMFPFEVKPLNDGASPFNSRKYAAYSYCWPSGILAGKTGVLFQPSRMAGDGYELNVYLAYDTDTEMETAAPATMPAGLQLYKNTGTFQIWRELDISKHWRMKIGANVGTLLDLVATKTKFEKYFIKLNLPGVVDHNIGTWFAGRNNIIAGTPPPAPLEDFIRDAADPAIQTNLIHFIEFDEWYTKMLAAHGGTDAAVEAWANGISNGVDALGHPRMSVWENLFGGNGMQPILAPWPVNILPDAVVAIDNTVVISFPNLPTIDSLSIVFAKPSTFAKSITTITPAQRQTIKEKISLAMLTHIDICTGSSNFISYGRGQNVPLQTGLNVQLSSTTGNTRRQDRLTNVKAAINAIKLELFRESSKNNYDNTIKSGWGFMIFTAVVDNALNALEGIVALQVTELSNKLLPAGKAFSANQAGDRAMAATLVQDPTQQTFEHEIGHALFLNHTYHTQEPSDPNYLHQKDIPSTGRSCIMHVTPSSGCEPQSLFCGFCIIRLWGWSYQTTDVAGVPVNPISRTIWYDPAYNKNPGSPANVPPHAKNVGTKQKITISITGKATSNGVATITVTANGLVNNPKNVTVNITKKDMPADVANKAKLALQVDVNIAAFFDVDGNGSQVNLTAKTKAVDDATMNMAFNNGTCAGIAPVPTAKKTTPGALPPLHPV